jgi:uncharacterized lipoprotein
MFRIATHVFRFTLLSLVLGSFLAGCSWFRSRPEYEGVEISKPLAIPADLNKPKSRDALQIPSKTLLGENAKSPDQVANFMVDDTQTNVWTRIGTALDGIEGVEVLNKAEGIKSYEVRYNSEIFLISTQANDAKTRVLAIGVDGAVQQSGVSGQLLAKLKAALQK